MSFRTILSVLLFSILILIAQVAGAVTPDQATTTSQSISTTAFQGHPLSPIGMYLAADAVVKGVLLSLMAASVVVWSLFLLKSGQLLLAQHRSRLLLARIVTAEGFHQATQSLPAKAKTLMLVQACQHELRLSSQGRCSDTALKERLMARLERVQVGLIAEINQGTGVLASVGAVGPFVGLFGTVWGIMNSFIGIAESQTTNLAVVAPGIAEALLATAVGLVAAIPAVVLYNFFSRIIGGYRRTIGDTISALMILISRDLDRTSPQARQLSAIGVND